MGFKSKRGKVSFPRLDLNLFTQPIDCDLIQFMEFFACAKEVEVE